jgi:hypothetical protein
MDGNLLLSLKVAETKRLMRFVSKKKRIHEKLTKTMTRTRTRTRINTSTYRRATKDILKDQTKTRKWSLETESESEYKYAVIFGYPAFTLCYLYSTSLHLSPQSFLGDFSIPGNKNASLQKTPPVSFFGK